MDYKTMRNQIEDMVSDNYKDFVKAVISMEKGINDESALDKLYEAYMDNDTVNLLHEEFDYMIEDLREQGQIKDLPYVQEEKDNLVNIVGNIVGKIDVVERENKNGEAFQVVNFSVASKDDEGNKVYHNCSAYGEKGDIPKDFKQGDFVKLFGQIRTSVDDNGKEHTNIRILSSKLLKAKEQMRGQEEKIMSVEEVVGMGGVKISDDVIATIASLAASEIEGVSKMTGSMAANLTEILGKKKFSKGVKVQLEEDTVEIDVFLSIVYGSIIQEVAEKVQENVKKAIESMTEFKVMTVNVHVQGVTQPEEEKQ